MDLLIQRDLMRYVPGRYGTLALLKGFRSHGFRYLFFMRKAASTNSRILRFVYRSILRRYVFKYGFQIPYNTRIGGGLHISHFGPIIINTGAVIGPNCNVNPGVVIGQTNRGEQMGFPTLGSKVWLGPNSVVVGKVVIGNDVLIAPGAFVNFDVPSHSIVIGNPGKIIPKENATEGYVCNMAPDEFQSP